MITETALTIAGPTAVLVGRPAGVAHVYVGPLTPSERFVPRGARAVCRAHTRRLAVLPERQTSLVCDPNAPRMCARCVARLSSSDDRRAASPCIHYTDYRTTYAALTWRDLWAQAVMAETLTELEHVAHLSLVVLGHDACERRLPVSHEEIPGNTLNELIGYARERLADYPNRARSEAITQLILTGYAQAKAERAAAWKNREDLIARIGFTNATT